MFVAFFIITKWLKVLFHIGRFSCRGAVAQNKAWSFLLSLTQRNSHQALQYPWWPLLLPWQKKNPVKEKTIKWIWAPFKGQSFVYYTFKIFLDVDFYNEVHMKISFLSLHISDYTIALSGLLIYKIHLRVVPVLFWYLVSLTRATAGREFNCRIRR